MKIVESILRLCYYIIKLKRGDDNIFKLEEIYDLEFEDVEELSLFISTMEEESYYATPATRYKYDTAINYLTLLKEELCTKI